MTFGSSLVFASPQSSPVHIRERAFAGTAIETFTIDLKCIFGSAVFSGCPRLTRFECKSIGLDVNEIPASFAKDASSLETFTWPEGLTSVGESAFEGCLKFDPKQLRYASTVSFGQYAFSGCPITSFTPSYKIQQLSAGLFKDCGELETVTVSSVSQSPDVIPDENCACSHGRGLRSRASANRPFRVVP